MKNIILVLIFNVIIFADNCSSEDMSYLLSKDKKSLSLFSLEKNTLHTIQSTQGIEINFHYKQINKKLQYVEINIYAEMGKKVIELFLDSSENVLVKSTTSFYNKNIYENNIKVLSKNIKIFPVCNRNQPSILFYGIKEKNYVSMKKIIKEVKSLYYQNFKSHEMNSSNKMQDQINQELKENIKIDNIEKK